MGQAAESAPPARLLDCDRDWNQTVSGCEKEQDFFCGEGIWFPTNRDHLAPRWAGLHLLPLLFDRFTSGWQCLHWSNSSRSRCSDSVCPRRTSLCAFSRSEALRSEKVVASSMRQLCRMHTSMAFHPSVNNAWCIHPSIHMYVCVYV